MKPKMKRSVSDFLPIQARRRKIILNKKTYEINNLHEETQEIKPVIIIPARYNSSRLPGKALKDIEGTSMLQRTFEQCIEALSKQDVYIATDNLKIKKHCEDFGANVLMTSSSCLTGTDRIAEASKYIKCDFVI
ncbi:hypothetical protein OAC11_07985, partial [Alphaproteobacteria bacterium]|nr:hypothetical protein [Alphaproteobacteria bacterium]